MDKKDHCMKFGFNCFHFSSKVQEELLLNDAENNVLIFDVETTGLKPKGVSITNSKLMPHIVQFSWVIYNQKIGKIIKKFDHIIHLPKDTLIPLESTEIHGITNEQMLKSDMYITSALACFRKDLQRCETVVAHNLEFDRDMINIEIYRNEKDKWLNLKNKILFCTMRYGEPLCKLTYVSKYNKKKKSKFPKLSELYEHLFDEIPENLHNSYVDVLTCLKCFLEMTK